MVVCVCIWLWFHLCMQGCMYDCVHVCMIVRVVVGVVVCMCSCIRACMGVCLNQFIFYISNLALIFLFLSLAFVFGSLLA